MKAATRKGFALRAGLLALTLLALPLLALPLLAVPLMAQTPASTPPAPSPAPEGIVLASFGPALHVTNIDRALRFYTEGLGMKLQMQMGPPNHHETMLGFAGDPRQPGIILLSDGTSQTPPAIVHGNAMEQLAMRVSNLPALVERLRRMGYAASDVRDVAMGYRMAKATDPDGYKLELVESGAKKGS